MDAPQTFASGRVAESVVNRAVAQRSLTASIASAPHRFVRRDPRAKVAVGDLDDERLAQLMQRVQQGQSAAYAELLRDVTPRLRSEIRRRHRFLPPHDVEDLVQDVLLSLHVVRATYDASRPSAPG